MYAPGDRITAGIIGLVLLAVVFMMADIASDGRLSRSAPGRITDEELAGE